ncbi:MAG: ABC transporter permease, partial [Mycoplasmataceae bacterium]|nr:ABC transporter permease [Mycoplasmataceae bacterium]
MFKTFMNEFRHMMKSKWRLASYILLLIIPTIYGFVTMNAFWKPFHHVDRLKVAVLNLDAGASIGKKGDALEKSIIDKKEVVLGSQTIGLNIQSIDGLYNTRAEAKKAVDDGKYSAIIVIPSGYSQGIQDAESEVAAVVADKKTPLTITRMVDAMLKGLKGNEVEFINSFKHNFLGGVMTNMGAAIDQLAKDALTAGASSTSPISKLLMSMKDKKLVIDHHIIGEHIDVYGKGFSPFFIAISLWAGA